jgi:leucyl/phenylalanyl-tRNA--protein transferase
VPKKRGDRAGLTEKRRDNPGSTPHGHFVNLPLPPELLLAAYSRGYFPMGEPATEEIAWYRPDPRAILPLECFHCSRSLKRTLKRQKFHLTFDKEFLSVMGGCANRKETWITETFLGAYEKLHRMGKAHSVETWQGDQLVGGIYGVALGGAFFAESKFHLVTDASKVALHGLVEHLKKRQFLLLEVQFLTEHLATLGAVEIPDHEYAILLKKALRADCTF